MAITPADIEKKTFSTALRGYDLDEVDDFLDEMVVAVRELEEELTRAKERIAQLEQDPGAPTPSPTPLETPQAPAPGIDESAVGRALVAAQQAADRMLEEARHEAERVVGDARSDADTFARDRDERRAAMEAEMADMTGLVAGVRTQLAVLATTVADKLDEMDAAVADVRDQVAGQGEAEHGDDDTPDEPVAAEPDAHDNEDEDDGAEDDDEAGLEIDIEEADTPDEEDRAGSSEIEGFRLQGEDEEI